MKGIPAARLAAGEYVTHTLSVLFLLNGRYKPYYKWSFRALRELPEGETAAGKLEQLLTGSNTPREAEIKTAVIEETAADVISVLQEQGLSEAVSGDLEKHAYSVNDGIRDSGIRNLHILATV